MIVEFKTKNTEGLFISEGESYSKDNYKEIGHVATLTEEQMREAFTADITISKPKYFLNKLMNDLNIFIKNPLQEKIDKNEFRDREEFNEYWLKWRDLEFRTQKWILLIKK